MIRSKVAVSVLFFLSLLVGSPAFAAEGSIYDLPVVFKNENGADVSLKKWAGKQVVVTMTYTSCEYACPRILKKLKDVQKEADRLKMSMEFVVITFDPTVDTSAKLKSYRKEASHQEKNWTFLTGTEEGARQTSMVLGIRFSKNPANGVISHDNKIILLDEKGTISKVLNGVGGEVTGFLE